MAPTFWFVGEYMGYVQTSKIHTDARFAIKPARRLPISPDFHRRETYTASRGVEPIDARPGDRIVIRYGARCRGIVGDCKNLKRIEKQMT